MSDRQMLYFVSAAVLIAAMLFGTLYAYNQQFVSNGYCETTLPGHSSMGWVKCK